MARGSQVLNSRTFKLAFQYTILLSTAELSQQPSLITMQLGAD